MANTQGPEPDEKHATTVQGLVNAFRNQSRATEFLISVADKYLPIVRIEPHLDLHHRFYLMWKDRNQDTELLVYVVFPNEFPVVYYTN